MLEVNKKLEARVLQERERRVTAEAEVGQLKRTLTFQRTVGAMQSFMRRGRVEDVEDEGAARILDDAATVIQRRHRGIAGRKKAREMCREIFEEDSPYDEHDGSLKTSGSTELTRSDWRRRRPDIGSVITEGSPKSSEVLMTVAPSRPNSRIVCDLVRRSKSQRLVALRRPLHGAFRPI